MHWQDFILSMSVLAFNIALVPSVFSKQKPRLATSVMTAMFLLPEVVVFINLRLWYSLLMTLLNALLWSILAFQRLRQPAPARARR